ncbi:hypothetical protein BDK51DRAFT_24407, partial [Blyttiomyces helicus]
ISAPVAVLGSEEERSHREKQTRHRQVQLLEITQTEAHKKLFEGQYDLAIPAALQALRFAMDVYGQNSIEIVPSYLLLGEASIGLQQYTQAEDYLSLAKWAVLKAEHCAHGIRAQLHRNFGLLYSSQGNYEEALNQLAQDVRQWGGGGESTDRISSCRLTFVFNLQIYHASLTRGPEHISVSGGYFQLGNVFHKQNRIDHATAVFDKVVSIWKSALKSLAEPLGERFPRYRRS